MNIITPISITSAMIGAGCSLAEDPTAAWAAGTFAVDAECHVVATHRVYRCALAGSSTLSPELDPARWVDMRPTNRMAPFDIYTSTRATSSAVDIVYPITARFVNAVALYGMAGSTYEVVVKDAVGGTTLATRTGRLRTPARGWYDYLFGSRRSLAKVVLTGLPIRPAAEITVTIRAGTGATRAIGMIVLGKYRPLIGLAAWGGTQRGASAEPVTYSYIGIDKYGEATIERGHKATNLRCTVKLPCTQADAALELLQEVLDVPCAWIATDSAGYRGLTTFGIASNSPVSYDSTEEASIDISIKGLI